MSRDHEIRTVRGILRCPRVIRSPIDGLSCAIAWTVIEGRSRWLRRAVRLQFGTTGDLLVESTEGLFAIEPAGLWIKRHSVLPQFPVAITTLPEKIQELLRGSRIDPLRPLLYAELSFVPGDRIELRGLVRHAPCTFLGGGLREPRVLPTLHAVRGRLLILTRLGPPAFFFRPL